MEWKPGSNNVLAGKTSIRDDASENGQGADGLKKDRVGDTENSSETDQARIQPHQNTDSETPISEGQSGTNHEQLPFIDPTPKTPRAASPFKSSSTASEPEDDGGLTPEIKHIMQQFEGGDDEDATETSGSTSQGDKIIQGPTSFPPRQSNLESDPETSARQADAGTATGDLLGESMDPQSATASLPVRKSSLPQRTDLDQPNSNTISTQSSMLSLPKELPPTPDPEPDLPFDFHRFLEQLRHRTADPVAKYLRSFLTEFGKKQWTAPEQVKFIHDFLSFIANKMGHCDVWRGVSDAEFDNAREGMEKLVMNRLYSQTFSPAIPPPAPIGRSRSKRKNVENLLGAGRRGQHQEDIERDEILSQKVRIYSWVQEEHLDIRPIGNSSKRLLDLAQQGRKLISTAI